MNILIIFESIEGQTRKIADFIEDRAKCAGHTVKTVNTNDKLDAVSFDGIEGFVLAAPVHERRHPQGFEVFVSRHREALKSRRTLMISVSLNAAFPESMDEAQDYATEMAMRTQFTPDATVLAAGAVRPGSYGYFESLVVRNVVLANRKIDLFDGVREFTDWDELGRAFDDFVTR